MRERLITSEREIVKDILNYKFENRRSVKDKHIAKIVTFALNNLSDEYFVSDGSLKVKESSSLYRGHAKFDFLSSIINLSDEVFNTRKGYGKDLIGILHEIMHFADKQGSIYENFGKASNKSSYNSYDLGTFITRYFIGFGEYKNIRKLNGDENFHNLANRVKEYSHSRYNLAPSEVRARRFSYDMLEKIIDIAKEDVGVNKLNEWANLRELEKTLNKERDNDYKKTKLAQAYLERHDEEFKNIFRTAREGLFAKDENGENAFDRLKKVGDNTADILKYNAQNGDIINDTLLTLVYDYDEEYANKLFDACLELDGKLFKYNISHMEGIYTITNFKPNEEQKQKFFDKVKDGKDDLVKSLEIASDIYFEND